MFSVCSLISHNLYIHLLKAKCFLTIHFHYMYALLKWENKHVCYVLIIYQID